MGRYRGISVTIMYQTGEQQKHLDTFIELKVPGSMTITVTNSLVLYLV